jgi:hypothetical protein
MKRPNPREHLQTKGVLKENRDSGWRDSTPRHLERKKCLWLSYSTALKKRQEGLEIAFGGRTGKSVGGMVFQWLLMLRRFWDTLGHGVLYLTAQDFIGVLYLKEPFIY